ncbi:MAG: enoyl-CoA hydratase/isomerase family protein [Gemmatimonadota bacterium]|nr:MAG: enoyl-CoA hydratase/isomerase family protein [Gemmatimonadota bacterium]
MSEAVPDLHLEVRDGLATLTFDRPDSKVNLLTRAVMLRLDELLTAVEEGAQRGEVRALLVKSGKRRNFIAGADIEELAALKGAAEAAELSRRGQEILLRLDRLPVPTLAAIRGPCVGGGLELALACDCRVASNHPSTRLGLPETRLGILPGLGGTLRLPRLIGLQPALDLILSGQQLAAQRAKRLGLIDRVLDDEDFDVEVAALAAESARLRAAPLPRQRRSAVSRLLKDGPPARWLIERLARRALLSQTKGHYPALPAALKVTVSSLGLSIEAALEQEAEAFGRLAVTPECKNLMAVFRLTEGARKRAPAGEVKSVKRAAVVGAGVMGAGIAQLFAYQTIPVHLVDLDEARVEAGLRRARELLELAAERAGWSGDHLKSRSACLRGAASYDGLKVVDVVVEAVPERIEVKQEVFGRIEERAQPAALIATNTSALSVSELQKGLEHPERVCGLHFFYPPHRMPLIEVVRGSRTSDDTLATAFDIAVRLGKTPIVVEDSPGFVVNRILSAYFTEAGHLLQTGISVEQLDQIMSRFGMPVGPLRLQDEIGLDVVAEVSRTMAAAFGERFASAPIVEAVLATGVTGRKGGRGFYRYVDSRSRGVNKGITRLLRESSQGKPPSTAEVEERLVFSMINEAARTLADGVMDSPETVDVAMIMGTGFPPFRGGLLRYADAVGLSRVADRLRHYADSVGARFEPAAALLERTTFYAA